MSNFRKPKKLPNKEILEAEQQIKRGKVVSWSEVKRRHPLRRFRSALKAVNHRHGKTLKALAK